MDCNPYLGIAATLVCGYLGLMEKKMPRPEAKGNAYINADELPTTLGDALDIFSECEPVREALTPEFCGIYEAVKRNEYKEFLQVISPWEREHLLLNV
jgi:glutamine synthetase